MLILYRFRFKVSIKSIVLCTSACLFLRNNAIMADTQSAPSHVRKHSKLFGNSSYVLNYSELCSTVYKITYRFVPFTCFSSSQSLAIGVGQLIALVLGLGGSWHGQLSSFPSSSLPRCALPTALATLSNAAYSKQQGQFSCSWTLRSRLPSLLSPGPALFFCPGKMQGTNPKQQHLHDTG